MWYPNRKQWWVIWGVYVVALLVSVEWSHSRYETRPLTLQELIDVARGKLQLHVELDKVKESLEKIANTQPYTVKEATQKLELDSEKSRLEGEISKPSPKEYGVTVERFDPSMPTAGFVTFLVIGGALAVWRLQTEKHGST